MFIRERSYNLLLRFIIKSSNLDLNSIKKLKKPKIYGKNTQILSLELKGLIKP